MEKAKTVGKLQSLRVDKELIAYQFGHIPIIEAFDKEVSTILSLLDKLNFPRSDQILLLKTLERLIQAYAGKTRKVEKINGHKKPKVFHQVEVLRLWLMIFDIIKNPQQHKVPKELLQDIEPYKAALIENKRVASLAVLHHDSVEDDLFIFVDEEWNHDPNALQNFFPNIDKSFDLHEHAKEHFETYCRKSINLSRFYDENLVRIYFPNLHAMQNWTIQGQFSDLSEKIKCQIKNEIATYRICRNSVKDWLPIEDLPMFLKEIHLYTPLKIDELQLENAQTYQNKLATDKKTLIGKFSDTLINMQSFSENSENFQNQAKQRVYVEKYTNRIHRLYSEMSFAPIVTSRVFSSPQYKTDKLISAKLEQEQKIAIEISELFKKNISKHVLPIQDHQQLTNKWLVDERASQVVNNLLWAKKGQKLEYVSAIHPLKELHNIAQFGVGTKEMVSVMDTNKYPFTKAQTLTILKTLLGNKQVDWEWNELIITPRGLKIMNDILNKALRFYTEYEFQQPPETFIRRRCKVKWKNKELTIDISSWKEFAEILRTARKKEGLLQVACCSILLNAYGCALLYLSKKVQDQNHKFTKILSEQILPSFQPLAYSYWKNAYKLIKEMVKENEEKIKMRDSEKDPYIVEQITNSIKDDCNHILTTIENLKLESNQNVINSMNEDYLNQWDLSKVYGDIRSVQIKNIYLRWKGWESVIHRFYRKVEDNLDVILDDLLWGKTEYYNIQDLLLHMNHMFYVVFKWKAKIKIKWLLTLADLERSKTSLSPQFYSLIEDILTAQEIDSSTGTWISDAEFNDAKLIGKVSKKESYPLVEWQFTLSDEKNTQRFNMHEAYDAKKIMNTVTRQEFYCSVDYINYLTLRYAYKYPKVRNLWDWDINQSAQNLSRAIQKKFIPVTIADRRPSKDTPVTFYTRKDRWNIISQTWLVDKDVRVYDKELSRWINKPFYSWQLDQRTVKNPAILNQAIATYKHLLNDTDLTLIETYQESINKLMWELESFQHIYYAPNNVFEIRKLDEDQNKIVAILQKYYAHIYSLLIVKWMPS